MEHESGDGISHSLGRLMGNGRLQLHAVCAVRPTGAHALPQPGAADGRSLVTGELHSRAARARQGGYKQLVHDKAGLFACSSCTTRQVSSHAARARQGGYRQLVLGRTGILTGSKFTRRQAPSQTTRARQGL
ncbi:hypothetical protein NDU88_010298 [Pleurodeles waltl]|uniref:Uncharacterized protein n=1 Tax=Pleurodeles waltl TaxID=8319 RepID=A0AAV7Q1J4_PLEWA|nr:hypothetical protein NDU88_010298 [Pleurodeles waltl]